MELAVCVQLDIWDGSLWLEEEVENMKQCVVTLAKAAGEDIHGVHLDKTLIDKLMGKFEIDTEGRKK